MGLLPRASRGRRANPVSQNNDPPGHLRIDSAAGINTHSSDAIVHGAPASHTHSSSLPPSTPPSSPPASPPASPAMENQIYFPTLGDIHEAEEYETKLRKLLRECECWSEFEHDVPLGTVQAPLDSIMARLSSEWETLTHGDIFQIQSFVDDIRVKHTAGMKLYHRLEKLTQPKARYLHPQQVSFVLDAVFTWTTNLSECLEAIQTLAREKEVYIVSLKRRKQLLMI